MSAGDANPIDQDVERMIVRRLDGELSAEEELALNRALIRDPEARARAEEYGRIDELARASLDAFASAAPVLRSVSAGPRVTRAAVPGYSRVWWLAPVAAAAALALMVTFSGTKLDSSAPPSLAFRPDSPAAPLSPMGREAGYEAAGLERVRAASHVAPARRNVDSETIGVLGEDGSIYWVEVDRTRTVRSPNSDGGVRTVSGDM